MKNFAKEFHTLNYVIKESDNILLFAHSHPDPDTTGSVLALREYAKSLGKNADLSCLDPFPESLSPIVPEKFELPSDLDAGKYKLIIACDSVERGFDKIVDKFTSDQVVAILDHHPDITMKKDINILDAGVSSVCELVYEFFVFNKIEITRKMATYLMMGILGDTGTFQHSNTTARTMEIASDLMKKGAPVAKIVQTTLSNKGICTLKLWGRAFEKAKVNSKNGMIASVITQKDMEECQASSEDIAQVASILNTVPGTKFSLILSEREGGIVKGSLRSEEYKDMDVSKLAATFGGGGHKLASGFEIKGKIVETEEGWKIV
ncbi:MAG: bifunctional oligoribonuclease/PAP phosphatase NrnA [Parcubacteria group bacterium]|jgi:phosphoesterase RecJ-like protein